MKVLKTALKILGGVFLGPVLLVSLMAIYWDLRGPAVFDADPALQLEDWVAVPSGDDPAREHASNTELIYFGCRFRSTQSSLGSCCASQRFVCMPEAFPTL